MGFPKPLVRTTLFVSLGLGVPGTASAQDAEAIKRGEYVYRATGGCTCHSDPAASELSLAGGRPIETPFGTIYGTNLTPDPETGLGDWSEGDFIEAMTEGVSPDGKNYYPVFPYTSFTKIKRKDLSDLWAYLKTLAPVKKENKEPEFGIPYKFRASLTPWRALYFERGTYEPDPEKSAEWNRGAYISTALAHCGECHTPRKTLGAPDKDLYYAGSVEGPEGELAPNITPHEETGIGGWSQEDIVWFLQTAFKPDGDDSTGLMGEVITNGYVQLEASDLEAIAIYLKSLAPIENEVKAQQ